FRIAPETGGTAGNILACEARARGVEVVFDFERGETVFADRAGAIAPVAITFPAAQRVVFAHNGLRAAPGPCAPKKNASFRVWGNEAKNLSIRRFMSPANRAGIGTCRPANSADPVVVASSGPNPSATLHEDRSAQLRRG